MAVSPLLPWEGNGLLNTVEGLAILSIVVVLGLGGKALGSERNGENPLS